MKVLKQIKDVLHFKLEVFDAADHRCIRLLLPTILLLLIPLIPIPIRLPTRIDKPRTLPVPPVSLVTNTLIRFIPSVITHRRHRGINGTRSPRIISTLVISEEVDTKGTDLGGPIDTDIVGCGAEFEAIEVVAAGPFSDGLFIAVLVAEGPDADFAVVSLLEVHIEIGVREVGWGREGEVLALSARVRRVV